MDIEKLSDDIILGIYKNRWASSSTIWEIVEKTFNKNIAAWEGNPEWLKKVPANRSKVRDNRIFLSSESQLNKVTARPFKPVVVAANETQEAREIAENVSDVLLEAYKTRNVKKTLKRGLRFLNFSRLICLKPFWNGEDDNFDVSPVDPRKVRFSANATNELGSEFAIEQINDKYLLNLLDMFPEEREEIVKLSGMSEDEILIKNPKAEWYEMWIGGGVCWIYKNTVIKKKSNPYWDSKGLLLTPDELASLKQRGEDGELTRNGRGRRQMFMPIKQAQADRREEVKNNPEAAGKYEVYLWNHFDKPRKPYIFGTIFEVEDQPIGRTSLIEIALPLQEGIDKRKRQIDDNSDTVNGITKVDTSIVTMTLADARKVHYDTDGLVYGDGVASGVTRETGQSLPEMVFKDLQDSRNELDEIFGTTSTFRGSGEAGAETATGRAILREEGYSRLDEVIALVDYLGSELYNWWFQMMKVRYTESHMTKILGKGRADRTIELLQDDLQEGIEIKISSGATLPDDKIYRAEKASEDFQAGLIDPVTYLTLAGGYENPEKTYKEALIHKMNPLATVQFSDEDISKIEEAQAMLAKLAPEPATPEGGGEGSGDERATAMAGTRDRIQKIVSSPQFQALPPEEKTKKIAEIRSALGGGTSRLAKPLPVT